MWQPEELPATQCIGWSVAFQCDDRHTLVSHKQACSAVWGRRAPSYVTILIIQVSISGWQPWNFCKATQHRCWALS